MLNLLNINYFMTLEKERNFSRAARKLYISQQSLSNHIKTLETEMDTKLFERTTPLRLTETGEILLRYCQSISSEYTQFLNEFNDAKQNKIGHLRIGVSFTRGRILLPKVLPQFIAACPDVKVSVMEGNRQEMTEALLDREIDMMIGEFEERMGREIETETLLEEALVMLVPEAMIPDHKTVTMELVADAPFLLCKSGNMPRTVADELFHKKGIQPRIIMELENTETLYELCKAGLGITFYPKSFLAGHEKDMREHRMHVIELQDEDIMYPIRIAYANTGYLSNAAKYFIEIAKEIYDQKNKGYHIK